MKTSFFFYPQITQISRIVRRQNDGIQEMLIQSLVAHLQENLLISGN